MSTRTIWKFTIPVQEMIGLEVQLKPGSFDE